MNIVITESASDDIAGGYLFYEEQFRGLGDYFETSIFADLRSLVIYAGVHEIHFDTYYRMIANRFPYAIYYTVENDTIRVHAVADTRRNPAWIQNRLSQS